MKLKQFTFNIFEFKKITNALYNIFYNTLNQKFMSNGELKFLFEWGISLY